jgi:6-pyruvoyl-tetrahydropterin synthase related domain
MVVTPQAAAVSIARVGQRWRELAFVCLTMGLVALAILIPFFFKGDASGHDFEFHVASWMEVARQWHEGVFYPRWAALANFGFGEPRFIFYPPASWMLGAALSLLLPWKVVPAAYIWLALVVAGCSMYRLAREWLPVPAAVAAGAVFAANPYHLLIVYWRSDFSELLASAVFPLLILGTLNLTREPRRALVMIAALVAFIWLTNAPAGVIGSYSAALLLVVLGVVERSVRPLVYEFGAMALGIALAAFYIVPAALEQSWVSIGQVLSSGLRPQDNFLFTVTNDPEHTAFNFLASEVAVGMLAALALAVGFAAPIKRRSRTLWWMLTTVSIACVVLMVPISSVLWSYVPKLRFVQFPWRWLFPLSVPLAAFVSTGISRARGILRVVLWTAAFAALAVCGWLLQRGTWWDADGVADLHEAILDRGTGYEGTDEYTPRDSDNSDLGKRAKRVTELLPEHEQRRLQAPAIAINRWYAEHKEFTVTISRPATLILRLLNYPAWRLEVDGHAIAARSSPETGQILIDVPPGTRHIRLDFIRTHDRTSGGVLSAIALIVWFVLWTRARRRSQTTADPSHTITPV